MSAEAELERIRQQNRARVARHRLRHPEAAKKLRERHRRARRKLRDLYPDEHAVALAAQRLTGISPSTAADRAHAAVRDAHPDEWREILAETT